MRVPNAVAMQALPRPIGRQAVLLIHTFFHTLFRNCRVTEQGPNLKTKSAEKTHSRGPEYYIYMIADELARAGDACDALRSDDPLRPEMRTRLEMTCAGDARPHAMRIWGVVVGCVLAGLVFAVAAAAVEVCNDGHCVKRAWHASRSGRTLWRTWCVREMGGPELRREAHLQAHAARREVVGQACMRVERHVVGGS